MSALRDGMRMRSALSSKQMEGVLNALSHWHLMEYGTGDPEFFALLTDADLMYESLKHLIAVQRSQLEMGTRELMNETPFDCNRIGKKIIEDLQQIRNWAQMMAEDCKKVLSEKTSGVLPFDRTQLRFIVARFESQYFETQVLEDQLNRTWPLAFPTPEFLEASRASADAGDVVSIEDMIAEVQ